MAHAAAAVAEAEADIRRKHRPLKVPENERAANEKRAGALAESQAKLRQVRRNALYLGLMLMLLLVQLLPAFDVRISFPMPLFYATGKEICVSSGCSGGAGSSLQSLAS